MASSLYVLFLHVCCVFWIKYCITLYCIEFRFVFSCFSVKDRLGGRCNTARVFYYCWTAKWWARRWLMALNRADVFIRQRGRDVRRPLSMHQPSSSSSSSRGVVRGWCPVRLACRPRAATSPVISFLMDSSMSALLRLTTARQPGSRRGAAAKSSGDSTGRSNRRNGHWTLLGGGPRRIIYASNRPSVQITCC